LQIKRVHSFINKKAKTTQIWLQKSQTGNTDRRQSTAASTAVGTNKICYARQLIPAKLLTNHCKLALIWFVRQLSLLWVSVWQALITASLLYGWLVSSLRSQ